MPPLSAADFQARCLALEWLLCDVDGVLTDGRVYYGAGGEPLVAFDIKDGLGLKLAQEAGLKVGLLSCRRTSGVEARAAALGLDAVVLGRDDKGAAFAEFLDSRGVAAAGVAYVGDDLLDLPVLARCGLSFAPADAVEEVREAVDRVLTRRGGRGAVRESVEQILRARGAWGPGGPRRAGADGT
jgi:3-deoxy-D-manno-octulosonate 8-phosphate phosphatase (KDO 8-P phosphatase)